MEIDTGNTAWLLLSSALVLLMTPGLALFYGGLNRSKGALNMMMMSFSCMGLISVLWVIYGFTLAFGTNDNAGLNNVIGSFSQYFGTGTATISEEWLFLGAGTGIPTYAIMVFQMMFAIITVALISGAVSDRMKFGGWILFAFAWFTLVYVPVAHWVWGGGWIGGKLHALDFAGGTAVHINAGAAALGLILVLGKRAGWPRETFKPHNVPFVALGAGLLWFGWFGFNAGSELAPDGTSALVWINTTTATCAAMLGWLVVEKLRDGHATSVGAASGVVAGLVAITPACGALSPLGSIVLGVVAGALSALAVGLKFRFGYDDSLDVVGVHLVGGLVGTIIIGFLATSEAPAGVDGLFYGGGVDQLWRQVVGALAVLAFSFILTLVIGTVIQKTMGFRITEEEEVTGIDNVEHAESGYDFASLGSSGSTAPLAGQARAEARSTEGVGA